MNLNQSFVIELRYHIILVDQPTIRMLAILEIPLQFMEAISGQSLYERSLIHVVLQEGTIRVLKGICMV